MIKIQELRIGNMLSIEGTFIKVGKIEENSISWNIAKDTAKFKIWNPFLPISDKRINPIPLTEEILLKFGFEYRKKNSKVIMLGLTNEEYETTLQNWITTNFFQISRCGINALSVEIKYVHQLQNIFFALTGEELTFKKD